MKAETSYNDFVGTAAADISDHRSLKSFLINRGVDTKRFDAIGVEFYHGATDFFIPSIICIDNQKSTDSQKHIVSLSFEKDITYDEFFSFFKRFKVVLTKKHHGYEEMKVNEELTIDDREVEKVEINEEAIRDEETDF